jgi:hypothetical protein
MIRWFRKLFPRRRSAAVVRRGDYRSVVRPRKQFEVLCERELRA